MPYTSALSATQMFPTMLSVGIIDSHSSHLSAIRQPAAGAIISKVSRPRSCQDYDKILTAMMRGAEVLRKGQAHA